MSVDHDITLNNDISISNRETVAQNDDFDIVDGHLKKYLGNEKHVIVPDHVSVVWEHAFRNCSTLERIDFPDSVRILVLGWGAKEFADSPHLHTVKLGKNIEHYNLSLPAKIKVIFPYRFEIFYKNELTAQDTARLLYGLYCRNGKEANYRNFKDVVHVFLTHPEPKVLDKCRAIMLANLEPCLKIIKEQISELQGESLQIGKRFLFKYDKSKEPVIESIAQAKQYCQENYDPIIGESLLRKIKTSGEELVRVRDAATMQSAPGDVSKFVFLQYMMTDIVDWDHNCEMIAGLLVRSDLEAIFEKTYQVLLTDQGDLEAEPIIRQKDFMQAYCRFASSAQVRALKDRFDIWEQLGQEGIAFSAHVKKSLALNDSLTALLLLDKLGELAYAAKIRDISLSRLRENLIPDLGFDEMGVINFEFNSHRLRVTVLSDLTLELFDEELGKTVYSFPQPSGGEDILGISAAKEFAELKEMLKEVRENQLASLKKQFIYGVAKNAEIWAKVNMGNPILRILAESIIWSYSQGTKKQTFRVVKCGSFIDVDGEKWELPRSGNVSVAHPINLTADEIFRWSKQLLDANISQPIAQMSESVIPFVSLNEIKNRYWNIVIPYWVIKTLDHQGFKIYGVAEYGYEADNGIVRLHFDFGWKASLSMITLEDKIYIKTLYVGNLNRTRAINHSLTVLDRLPIFMGIKDDDIDCLIKYIEEKNIGLDEDEMEEFLAVANKYNSFKCTAELLHYKNKHSRFKNVLGDLWL